MDLLIYGSCVSRDMIEFCRPEGVNLRGYIARQSWCSIGNPVNESCFSVPRFDSPFLQRTYEGDLKGDALSRISAVASKHPDLHLLIDLTDERGGFFVSETGGVVSNTPDSPAAEELAAITKDHATPRNRITQWRYLRFGALGHALSFTEAAEHLEKVFKRIGIWDRTTILANKWAETLLDGRPTERSFRMDAAAANTEFSDYFDMLRATGWNVAEPADKAPLGDPNHKWGAAPFHYTQSYYQSMWEAIGYGIRTQI